MAGNKSNIYTIYYNGVEDGVAFKGVGSSSGKDEEEALEKFRKDYEGYDIEITGIEIYK